MKSFVHHKISIISKINIPQIKNNSIINNNIRYNTLSNDKLNFKYNNKRDRIYLNTTPNLVNINSFK